MARTSAPPRVNSYIGSGRALFRGLPGGSFMDEAFAAADATFNGDPNKSWRENWNRAVNEQRAYDDAFDKAHPHLSTGMQLAGGLVPGVGWVGMALKGARAAKNAAAFGRTVAKSAAAGTGAGAVHGFGLGEGGVGSRLTGARDGAAVGGTMGAVTPVVGWAGGKLVSRIKGDRPRVASMAETAAQSADANDRAAKIGLAVPASKFKRGARDMQAAMMADGYVPGVHGYARNVVEHVGSVRGSAPFHKVAELRSFADDALAKTSDAAERRMIVTAKAHLDEMPGKLTPEDLPARLRKRPEAVHLLAEVQEKGGRAANAADVERMRPNNWQAWLKPDTAKLDAAARELQNPHALRQRPPEAQEVIDRMARRGPVQEAAQRVGKIPLGAAYSAGQKLGEWTGQPALAEIAQYAAPAAVLTARYGPLFSKLNDARRLSEMARYGGLLPVSPSAAKTAVVTQGILGGATPALLNGVLAVD